MSVVTDTKNKIKTAIGGLKIFSVARRCIGEIKDDVKAVKERDPAAKSTAEIMLTYSGLHAVLVYRVSHKLYEGGHFMSARMLSQTARFFTGIEIHPGATIGKGLFIDHGSGVVIGETAELGDNCTLYQGVTLGGTGKDTGKRHPTLGNNVLVGSGAKVLGPFTVGDNSKVAANAVVLKEVPANCTAVGIPARIVKSGGERVPQSDLDQIHIPDPVAIELKKLSDRLSELEAEPADSEPAADDIMQTVAALERRLKYLETELGVDAVPAE
ncbi:MAG: serine O-acetyltransferase [Clostridia bacterium]|nr:serine O-acetyltransferase [Clostridia bacterium]